MNYQVNIEVTVSDRAALAAYAKARAIASGISEEEFKHHEAQAYDGESEVEFWIGWIFDNGSPEGSGIQIEDSSVSTMAAG